MAHLGILTSPTFLLFYLIPKSNPNLFTKNESSSIKNSGINSFKDVALFQIFLKSPLILLNNRSGLSNLPDYNFNIYYGFYLIKYPIT